MAKGATRRPGPRRDSDDEVTRDRNRSRGNDRGRSSGRGGRDDDDDRGSRRGNDRGSGRGGNDRGKVRRSSSGGGSRFKYQERSVDQVKRQAERKTGRFDSPVRKDVDIFRPQDGENTTRICPATWPDSEHYAYKVWMHRFIGSDGSNYLCPRKMLGKACAICDAEKEARDAGEEDDAKDLAVRVEWAMWILDRDGDDPKHPMVYFVSDFADKDMVARTYNSKRGDALPVDHPEMGYDLFITKTGKMLRTRYRFDFDREQSPLLEDQEDADEVLDYITENPIPDVLHFFDNSYLETVVRGTTDHDEDSGDGDGDGDSDNNNSGDDDDNRGSSKRRPLRARNNRNDPDGDDGDGDGDGDDPPFDTDGDGDDDGGPEDGDGDGDGDDDNQDDNRGRSNNRRGGGRSSGRDDRRQSSRSGRGGGRSERSGGRGRFRD